MIETKIQLYKSAKDNIGYTINFNDAIATISDSTLMKDLTTAYRSMVKGDAKDDYKVKNFKAVTWSGTFAEATHIKQTKNEKYLDDFLQKKITWKDIGKDAKKRIIKTRLAIQLAIHSGLICIDIDKLQPEQCQAFAKMFKADHNVLLSFVSPSGCGIKLIFKIEPDAAKHLQYFNAIANYIKTCYGLTIDPSGKDVSRLCFLCYDANYHYNPDAILFDISKWNITPEPEQQKEPKPYTKEEEKELQSIQTLDDIVKFTERKLSYVIGQRTTFINLFAWNCNLRGFSEEDCKQYVLTNFSDHPQDQSKNTIESLYRNKSADHGKFKKRTNTTKGKTGTHRQSNDGTEQQDGPTGGGEGADNRQDSGDSMQQAKFWTERKVKRGKGQDQYTVIEYDIRRVKFVQWLFDHGFFILKSEIKGGYQLCKHGSNIVETVEPWEIKQYVLEWSQKYFIEDVQEMIRAKSRMFSMDEMTGLKPMQITFRKDTAEESYFYFKNKWVSVTSDGITAHDYDTFKEFIWARQQRPHNFELTEPVLYTPESYVLNPDNFNCEFQKFLFYVSYNPNDPDEKDFTADIIKQRFECFCSAVGFLLDGYKHPGDRKAVFAVDHKIGDKYEKHGGTGKSIIAKACGHLKVVSTINGDEFDPKYQFRFEPITADTQIINFNDMRPNFDPFEIFTIIADDYTVIRRNNGHLYFKYEDSAKVYYSTNAVPKGDGSSYIRRAFTIEFSDFFTPENTPFDFFGHGLFSSAWDEQEWNRFYNFMLFCVQLYKHDGLVKYPNSNLDERRLKSEVDIEFIDYLDNEFPKDKRVEKKPHFETVRKLLQEANGGGKPLTANAFARCVKRYCITKGYFFNPHIPPGKYDKVGGIEYYTIATKPTFNPFDNNMPTLGI